MKCKKVNLFQVNLFSKICSYPVDYNEVIWCNLELTTTYIYMIYVYTYTMNESTKVQTLGAIPGRAVCQSEHTLMKRVFEKAHTLLKCTSNGGIRNIARKKTETITCNGTYTKN